MAGRSAVEKGRLGPFADGRGFGSGWGDLAGVRIDDLGNGLVLLRRAHYRDELDDGHVKANAKVAENLYRKVTGEGREAVTAAIFWLKTRAGWKETSVHEVGGKDGRPVEMEIVVPGAREILQQRLAAIQGRLEGPPPARSKS